MWLSKLIVTAIALALIVVLYFLPKVVVDNEQQENAESIGDPVGAEISEAHERSLSAEEQSVVEKLKNGFNTRENPEKSANFADSLAGLFAEINYLDSAAYYYGVAAEIEPVVKRWLKAGESYFDAYSYAVESQRQQQLGEKAREYFELALGQDPGLNDVKAKAALTYLPHQPMQAVMMLREVVENDPENELGLYNLGLLSLQSQQFDKAVSRFEVLTTNYPDHLEGQFYLGVSYFENGNRDQARQQFEKVKAMDPDPEVLTTVDEYLDKLK
jgi:tetratricopeptide (TPR) repeat protein